MAASGKPRVKVQLAGKKVTVTGPRGTITKEFRHLQVVLSKPSKKTIKVDMWFAAKKQASCVNTVVSHIKNMFKGVVYGFLYKMRSVYAHFSVNMNVIENGTSVEIRNYLGEKYTRTVKMSPGVQVKLSNLKDELVIEGNDIEQVSMSAASIHHSCRVTNKDIRKFLDGIYVAERTTVVPME